MKIDTENDLRPPMQELCMNTLIEKYGCPGETQPAEIRHRVATAIGADAKQTAAFETLLQEGFVPGGRINRSAGAGLATTLINCFVQEVGDTMTGRDHNGRCGIMDALSQAAETMRRGGGVGYDFSAIRPAGAMVAGTASQASGPVSYMRVFDRMCSTVESAGARRGAQMGVLRVDHPDIERFIDAKTTPDFAAMGLDNHEVSNLMRLVQAKPGFGWEFRKAFATLSNFNISVAVTDEFMEAVKADGSFDLVHEARPANTDGVVQKQCDDGKARWVYRTIQARDLWAKILRNTFDNGDPGIIFISRVNKVNNLWYCEQIRASNPCGEQMLPSYGCCDLGSVMLQECVRHPFAASASFDTEKFRQLVRGGVRFLDRVLDVTPWPLPQQHDEAMNKRRIGLGYLGLADCLAMLGLRYDSDEGREFAADVTRLMRDEAYRESVDLAKKFGAFPYFDAEKYLREGTFASTLPDDIKDGIRKYGIRNSHLLSIAPTGTISLTWGNNASSGIEPIFAKRQRRTKVLADGSRGDFFLDNAAYAQFRAIHGDDADDSVFQTALQMSVDGHLKMVEAVAPFIDSAISKTVNIPSDYPFEDFEAVYMKAYEAGLKGLTTYKPSVMVGSVLAEAAVVKDDPQAVDPDRRVVLKTEVKPTAALRWPNRPDTPHGAKSVTYWVPHPQGDFAVIVGHYENGRKHPLEVFVASNSAPRGLAAIAKSLSVDMRSGDPEWLAMKLDSLRNTHEDGDAFQMADPATGALITVPSLVSGFAMLVQHALNEIGALAPTGESPMMQSLFSRKEPKTGPSGAIGWHVDIRNDATGDDFLLTTKDVVLEDSTVRPYSIWLAGKFPKALNGLAKMLSIDMRVSDPAWIQMKLRKLLKFGEQRGDFLAFVPGGVGQQNYPSTVGYIAAVLLERYKALGLADGGDLLVQPKAAGAATSGHTEGTGMICPSCHTANLHKVDGCKTCSHCNYVGECG